MLTLTDNAQKAISRFIHNSEAEVEGLRVSVSGGGCSGFKVFVDPMSAPMLEGVTLDFLDSMEGSGFKFENPNATQSCGCGKSFSC
jgi:iron-sulfur cluster assembly protein